MDSPTPAPIERALDVYLDWKQLQPRPPFQELVSAHPELVEQLVAFHAEMDESAPLDAEPQQIGPYRILERIGQGGMGVVYVAEQREPVQRRVALKVIKLGMDTKEVLARFDLEHQVLSVLNHPGIARVFDAGMTDEGRPYFVMEHVPGEPLVRFCDREQLGTAARLELFISICHAVQHAHQKGVIHRDLKPSNILVTLEENRPPTAKIIDFGVAKATTQRVTHETIYTEIGKIIGTPAYMSPEQAERSGVDIDTRTDVYSLGVVLYELLTGVLPFNSKQLSSSDPNELQRIIREVDPPKPSTRLSSSTDASEAAATQRNTDRNSLARRLRGDLDWITMKALEKSRARRYDSVSELAADVRRHLEHEPVLAGPPSATYRVRKFVRKHRTLVATGIVIIGVVLAAFFMVLDSRDRERAARDLAERQAQSAQRIASFLTNLFQQSDPISRGGRFLGVRASTQANLTAREILDRGARELETDLSDHPLVRARLLDTIGNVYLGLGLTDQAAPLIMEALTLRRSQTNVSEIELVESLQSEALLLSARGVRCSDKLRDVLKRREKLYPPGDPAIAQALVNLGVQLGSEFESKEAATVLERALASIETAYGEASREAALVMLIQAQVQFMQGKVMSVIPVVTRAAKILDAQDETTEFTGLVQSFVQAQIAVRLGNPKRARALFEQTLSRGDKLLGREHYIMAWVHEEYAQLIQKDRTERALALELRLETLRRYEAIYGKDSHLVVGRLIDLARVYRGHKEYEEAIKRLQRALAIYEMPKNRRWIKLKTLGSIHHIMAAQYTNLEQFDLAEPQFAKALDATIRHYGIDKKATRLVKNNFVRYLLLRADNPDEAGVAGVGKGAPENVLAAGLFATAFGLAEERPLDVKTMEVVQGYARQKAMKHLRLAIEAGFGDAARLRTDEAFEPIRTDEGFQAVLDELSR